MAPLRVLLSYCPALSDCHLVRLDRCRLRRYGAVLLSNLLPVPRTHERSGHVFAPVARMRAFKIRSIRKERVNKVGQ